MNILNQIIRRRGGKIKHKIINFFHRHRLVDIIIGIIGFHIWIYILATYLDMYIFTIQINFSIHSIFCFSIELNRDRPHFRFKLTFFKKGIDTNREIYIKSNEWYKKYVREQRQKFKELLNGMTEKEKKLAKEYCSLHIYED